MVFTRPAHPTRSITAFARSAIIAIAALLACAVFCTPCVALGMGILLATLNETSEERLENETTQRLEALRTSARRSQQKIAPNSGAPKLHERAVAPALQFPATMHPSRVAPVVDWNASMRC